MMMINRTTHEDPRLQAGKPMAEKALYEDAAARRAKLQPTRPRLCSLQGCLCCELLRALARGAAVREGADHALQTTLSGRRVIHVVAVATPPDARAKHLRRSGDFKAAKTDLDEVCKIASHGLMIRRLADHALESARLRRARIRAPEGAALASTAAGGCCGPDRRCGRTGQRFRRVPPPKLIIPRLFAWCKAVRRVNVRGHLRRDR